MDAKNVLESAEIKKYSFMKLEDNPSVLRQEKVRDFQIRKFDDQEVQNINEFSAKISNERKIAEKNNFQVATIVSKHRGLLEDREKERQRKIEAEVMRRVGELKEQAIAEGFAEGKKKGEELVINELRGSVEEKLQILHELINDVVATRDEILAEQNKQMFTMVKNLTKWVILRELENDGEYLNRLLEKLISELQAKSNILIQVSKQHFEQVPEALELLEDKIGKLENVRVEVDYEIQEHGLIVSSENAIINGTLEQQFANLSKLFESVGVLDE
jgi:flagellar assembly protein FliH